MLGNFSYCNPTKLYFGKKSLNYLNDELSKYGKNVVLIYGGGSIKKNGIYDAVTALLKENGKNVTEISGVMPNPTVAKLHEGIQIARAHKADLLLAVGGGSVCDYSKARRSLGRNILFALKNRAAKSSLSAASLLWSAPAPK